MNDKDKRAKELTNEELFKQALIEGLNNRFQREIDSCKDYNPPDDKHRMENKHKILKACAAVRPDIMPLFEEEEGQEGDNN